MSELSKQVAHGAVWMVMARWVVRLMGLGSVVVLARLLDPEDFGVAAVAGAFMGIIEGLSHFDPTKALVQRKGLDEGHFETAWTLAFTRGAILFVLMVASAPVLASFMDDDRLKNVVFALALIPLLKGLQSPKIVVYEKSLNFSRVSVILVTTKLASLMTTVSVAIIYESYWALVLGQVVSVSVGLILTYILAPFFPRFSFSRWRDLFSFGVWVTLSSMVSTLSRGMDNFLIGRFLQLSSAGLYFMVRQISALPSAEIVQPLQNVLFPTFSQVADRPDQLRRLAVEVVSVLSSIGLATSIGFALIAEQFVPIVLGEKWLSIVSFMEILLPVLGFQAVFSVGSIVALSTGRTKELFWNSLWYAMVRVPLFVVGLLVWGLEGAIWGVAISGAIFCALQYRLLRLVLGIGLGQLFYSILRPILASMFMIAGVSALAFLLSEGEYSISVVLLLKILTGGIVFMLTHFGLWLLMKRPSGIERRIAQAIERF